MPRRSGAFFETLPHAAPSSPIPRLKPPESMSEAARKVFLDLVVGSRADQFQVTDLPLLCRYAEAAALADRAEGEIARRPLVKGKPNPWAAHLAAATKTVSMMAMRLRLSPQARAPNNPSRGRAAPMSYYERMDFEKQLNDEDAPQ
jgi:phage terminase small subunit